MQKSVFGKFAKSNSCVHGNLPGVPWCGACSELVSLQYSRFWGLHVHGFWLGSS